MREFLWLFVLVLFREIVDLSPKDRVHGQADLIEVIVVGNLQQRDLCMLANVTKWPVTGRFDYTFRSEVELEHFKCFSNYPGNCDAIANFCIVQPDGALPGNPIRCLDYPDLIVH